MMGNRCKVCGLGQKKLQSINQDLVAKWRSRDGFRKIAKRWGVSLPSLYRHFCTHLPAELWRSEQARRELSAETLMAHLNDHYSRLQKLLAACEEVLQDPSDPTRWVVGSSPKVVAQARSEDLTIYFQQLLNGKVVNHKAKLDTLIERIEAAGSKESPLMVTSVHYHGEDVKRTARETAKALREYIELAGKLSGQLAPELDLQEIIELVVRSLRPHPKSLVEVIAGLRQMDVPLSTMGRN